MNPTPVVDLERLAKITYLDIGEHAPGDEFCFMEAVAYVADEVWTDSPSCVSPVLGAFGRLLNDDLDDDLRQRLIPMVPRPIGTAGDGLDEKRYLLALDWQVRVHASTWLNLAGLTTEALALRDLKSVEDEGSFSMMLAARTKAYSARKAAEAVSGDGAARDAVGIAGISGGPAVTVASAGSVRLDSWNASVSAAAIAARTVPEDVLQSTIEQLQQSSINLFDSMMRPA